jgi:hypothetical protein
VAAISLPPVATDARGTRENGCIAGNSGSFDGAAPKRRCAITKSGRASDGMS